MPDGNPRYRPNTPKVIYETYDDEGSPHQHGQRELLQPSTGWRGMCGPALSGVLRRRKSRRTCAATMPATAPEVEEELLRFVKELHQEGLIVPDEERRRLPLRRPPLRPPRRGPPFIHPSSRSSATWPICSCWTPFTRWTKTAGPTSCRRPGTDRCPAFARNHPCPLRQRTPAPKHSSRRFVTRSSKRARGRDRRSAGFIMGGETVRLRFAGLRCSR